MAGLFQFLDDLCGLTCAGEDCVDVLAAATDDPGCSEDVGESAWAAGLAFFDWWNSFHSRLMRDANRIIRPVELVQANISHSRKIFDRLVAVAESRGESLATVSKALGLHLSSFYRWKKGSMPQDRTVRLVAEYLRVREEWLRDGTEPRDPIVGDRLSPIGLSEPEKEEAGGNRLEGSSTVFRPRPSLPTTSTVKPAAINAAAARLSDEELEEVLSTSIQRLREEPEPLLKLGYLATLKACVDDMERRLSGEPQ